MAPLKIAILGEIRKSDPDNLVLSDEELSRRVFYTDGMRLSFYGFNIMKTIFKTYSFELPIDIKSKHYMAMSSFQYPYYTHKSKLILFSDQDAMMIQLHGDVGTYLGECYDIDNKQRK